MIDSFIDWKCIVFDFSHVSMIMWYRKCINKCIVSTKRQTKYFEYGLHITNDHQHSNVWIRSKILFYKANGIIQVCLSQTYDLTVCAFLFLLFVQIKRLYNVFIALYKIIMNDEIPLSIVFLQIHQISSIGKGKMGRKKKWTNSQKFNDSTDTHTHKKHVIESGMYVCAYFVCPSARTQSIEHCKLRLWSLIMCARAHRINCERLDDRF